MQKFKLLLMAIAAIFLVSCSSSKEESKDGYEVTVDKTTIGGKLSEYFSLVDKTYKYKPGLIDKIAVELECIKPLPENMKAYIAVEVLDEDGTVISAGKADAWSFSDFEVLRQASTGQTITVEIQNYENVGDDSKPAKIRLSSLMEEDTDAASPSDSDDSSGDESSFDLSNVILPSQLKGKVEVISAEKSVGSYGYPSMEITFKLIKTVSTSSLCSEYGQMWIVGVGQTESGVDVKELLPNYREWRSGDSDGNEFKSFLESDPGETITLEFTGDKESSDDVAADLEKVKKFKLKITN